MGPRASSLIRVEIPVFCAVMLKAIHSLGLVFGACTLAAMRHACLALSSRLLGGNRYFFWDSLLWDSLLSFLYYRDCFGNILIRHIPDVHFLTL